jgi:quinol monooxygenase YgiN
MQRIVQTPWPGKAGELTQILTEQVRARQAKGQPAALIASLAGVGAPLAVALRFESLGDFERFREENRTDKQFQAFLAKLGPLLAAPSRFELWESTIDITPERAPRFVQRVETTAAPGKAGQMTQLLTERIRSAQGDGVRRGLAQTILGEPGRFAVTLLFDSIEAFEELRVRNMKDPGFQQFQERISALAAGPATIELNEVLVPFQPVATREMAGAARR